VINNPLTASLDRRPAGLVGPRSSGDRAPPSGGGGAGSNPAGGTHEMAGQPLADYRGWPAVRDLSISFPSTSIKHVAVAPLAVGNCPGRSGTSESVGADLYTGVVTPLTDRFDQAIIYALSAHRAQSRKGTEIPYAAHLLAVASIVLEVGGDETAAVVALLHDVVEDQGGADRLADVRRVFGDVVADAVSQCSAEEKSHTTEWRPRKLRYIAQMRTATPLALLVSLADKTHNLRAILADYREHGSALFSRFNAPDGDAVLWYYSSLLDVYTERVDELPRQLVDELGRDLNRLRGAMNQPDPGRQQTA
jgi:hypothetical protein